MPENVRASTSHNPKGLHNLYRDNCTFICVRDMILSYAQGLYPYLTLVNGSFLKIIVFYNMMPCRSLEVTDISVECTFSIFRVEK
jgi:hypothetical protein